jgi:hypothetical protein
LIHFGLGGTVETGIERIEKAQYLGVRVAFDSIMRLDSVQVQLPSKVLAVDFAEVGHEKSILLSGITGVSIDVLDVTAQGASDQTA